MMRTVFFMTEFFKSFYPKLLSDARISDAIRHAHLQAINKLPEVPWEWSMEVHHLATKEVRKNMKLF